MKNIAELVEKAGRAVCDVIYLSGEKDGVKAEIRHGLYGQLLLALPFVCK